MVTLIEAFRLTDVRDDDIVYLRPKGQTRFYSIIASGKRIREKLDMKRVKVVRISPRFEVCGYDYEGIEFTVTGPIERIRYDG